MSATPDKFSIEFSMPDRRGGGLAVSMGSQLFLFTVLLGLIFSSVAALGDPPPPLQIGHAIPKAPEGRMNSGKLRDMIRLTADPPYRRTHHLGEPFIVRLRLVNHTDFTVTALTNFIPTGDLAISIRRFGEVERRYKGPYPEGEHPSTRIRLYPLEEYPEDVVIWSDPDTSNGLAFDKPGRYFVLFELQVDAVNSPWPGKQKISPVDPSDEQLMTPLAAIEVDVVAPREDLAPLVSRLIELKAFPSIQIQRIRLKGIDAREMTDGLIELIERYPATPITPYMDHTVAFEFNRLRAGWTSSLRTFANPEAVSQSSYYYQRAVASDYAFKHMALFELMELFDRAGMPLLARDAGKTLLETSPFALAVRFGTHPLVAKYLINSVEMSPEHYYNLLD